MNAIPREHLCDETLCAERYRHIADAIAQLAQRIGRLEMLVWTVAGAVITGMGAVILRLAGL